MSLGRHMAAAVAAALTLAAGVGAQDDLHGTDCATPGELPSDLLGWDERVPLEATPAEYDLAYAALAVGAAVDATLAPINEVDFIVDPERWPDPGTYAACSASRRRRRGPTRSR